MEVDESSELLVVDHSGGLNTSAAHLNNSFSYNSGGGSFLQSRPRLQKLVSLVAGTEARASASIFAFVVALGVVLGFAVPVNEADYVGEPDPAKTISSVIGWIYFAAWSVSFWPQIITNYKRRSVVGLSFDYVFLNLLGFTCYTVFNCALYYNAEVRRQYAADHDGSLPSVHPNDVFFAIHAVFCTALVCLQIALYERGGQRMSRLAAGAFVAMVISIAVVAICAATRAGPWFTWLNFINYLSYIKLAITVAKYAPQAVLNWRRKSTEGWTIHNIVLDFTGGLLSLGQEVLDCSVKGDWSGIAGNPVKFGLGFTSMVYDIVFMIQHYCLYAPGRGGAGAGKAQRRLDQQPLLAGVATGPGSPTQASAGAGDLALPPRVHWTGSPGSSKRI